MELKILSFNISGANCSEQATYGVSEKHRLVAQEVLRHSPDVIALQVRAARYYQQALRASEPLAHAAQPTLP